MEKMDYSISMIKANFYSVVFAVPVVFLTWIYIQVWGLENMVTTIHLLKSLTGSAITAVSLILGIILHELIHGYAWRIFSHKPKESIRFGINWKAMSPYAHCTESMSVIPYRIGCIMPAIIVGFIPYLAGLLSGSASLTLFGLFFTFAASGDFLILWTIRNVHSGSLVEDHPTHAGCFVYDNCKNNSDSGLQ